MPIKFSKIIVFIIIIPILLTSCRGPDGKVKLPGGDARKTPADPAKRVEQNLKEGRGFRLTGDDGFFSNSGGRTYEFATANELWRASLDTLDFMPLASVNYSGGIIITDWYSNNQSDDESIKISIRFLTNEIRSDALDINVYIKKCSENLTSCSISKNNNALVADLNLSILKKATRYEKKLMEKRRKQNPYEMGDMKAGDGRKKD